MRDVSNSDLEVSDTNPIPYNSFFFFGLKRMEVIVLRSALRGILLYHETEGSRKFISSVRVAKG